ncbi:MULTISPECIES: tetratricopeptide repeat protein [Actinomadura]|uniref:Tetratricopeptide repeat protein n=1 Tax=Actinomadura yumaensis TaxID=111807 RepID=A0ABW2CVF0_9ACTN|nr:tetratricopeptide repeat protein [Actinomadura sp. J1-007]MWK39113.1 tetratricopeptide repeat protein [Actinomadura sp. J1-007]
MSVLDHDVRPGSFWARLAVTERQALRAMGRRTVVPPGGMLCHQGVTAPGVHVLFGSGARTVTNVVAKEFVDSSEGDESIIELYGAGDLIGGLAPWGHPQRGTVAALGHVAALRIDRRKFGSLLDANPQVTEAMMHTIAERDTCGGRRHAVRAADHPQRLAYHLLELGNRFGERTSKGIEIPLRLSQADLANWSGISRETLVRWFRLWRDKEILSRKARPLTILDPEALRKAASPWGDEWPAASRADEDAEGLRPASPDWGERAERRGPGPRPVPRSGAPRAGGPAKAGRTRSGIAVRTGVRLETSSGRPPGTPLPADNPFFTGRTVSLGKLDLLVAQSELPRAVVIQGMAGVGKTTLALHWAHRVAERFPDGVIFTDLRGTARSPVTPAEAMGQVLRGVGVPGDQLPRTEDELGAQCRSLLRDRRTLLILDNAASARQIRPLLAAAGAGFVIVTSRRRLPALLEGADIRTLELREMVTQEAVDLIAAVLGPADARVREEHRAVERLARECGFLPLALAVMAGKLAENPGESIAGTVRELADHDAPAAAPYTAGLPVTSGLVEAGLQEGLLHESFLHESLLNDGAGQGTGLHEAGPQGLRAVLSPTFDVAYRGLRRDQREAFRRLALVAGPDFTPATLATLMDRPLDEASECLDGLRQAYLVHDAAPGRYRLHELLRDFARERGLSEDADNDRLAAQRRLLAGYLADARAAGAALGRHRRPSLAGPSARPPSTPAADRAAGLAWFEAERRNLVAAVHQASRLGLHRTCWELADALFDFQAFRRYSEDNIAVHHAGLRAARTEEDWAAAAVMLHNLAVAHFELGRAVQAVGYGEDARRAFRSADPPDRYGEAISLGTLADVHAALGRYLTAIEHARRALGVHASLDDDGGVAKGHETLARAHLGLGDYEAALAHAGEALGVRRRTGDLPGVAETLLTLAQVHRRRGDVHEAVSHALEALYIRQDHADRHGAAQALTELARMNAGLGLRDMAQKDAEQALRTYRALGARHGEARALTTLGMLMCDAARFAEAFTYCGQALRLHREIGDRHGEAEALAQIGVAHWRLGRYREAREQLVRALEIRREIGDQHGEAHDLEHLSVTMRRLERHQEAFVLGLEALDLWHQLGARGGLAGTLGSLARTYLRLGLPEDAERAARQALRIREEGGDWYGMGVGMDTFAAVLRRSGRPEEALEMERRALRLLGEVGDRHGEGTALVHLAAIQLDLGRAEEGLETGRRALDLATELGDTREQAYSLRTMGRACQRLGKHASAVGHFRTEIVIRRDMDDHRGQRIALEALRESHLALGDAAAAADCARRTRALDKWLEAEGQDADGPAAGEGGAEGGDGTAE